MANDAPNDSPERARLDALHWYKILDTEPEPAFDELTKLAAKVCGVPFSMISFIDEDRQWVKSRYGLSLRETPREDSFCAETIVSDTGLLSVEDAANDPRFTESPLVTGDEKVRFYAGVPLVAEGGHAIGALSVMDRAPRTLTPEQEESLGVLGRQVMAQMELRRQAADLRSSLSTLNATLDATADGILVVDVAGKIVTFNRQFVEMWNMPRSIAESRSDDAAIAFVLDQLADPAAFVKKVMELYSEPDAESYDLLEFKNGRRFERYSRPRRVGGRYAGRVWSFRDVTDLVRVEKEASRAVSLLRATLDSTADGILVVDTEGRLVDFNQKVVEMWEIPNDIVTSLDAVRLREFVADKLKDPEKFLKKVKEIYSDTEGQSYDWLVFKDGRIFERYSRPQQINNKTVGRVWSFRDVTEQKRLEEKLERLQRQVS